MNYTGIIFKHITKEQIDILVALLPDMGFHGMEEKENELNAYSDEAKADLTALSSLAAELNVVFSMQKIESKNWNESWESNFSPVSLHGKIQVRAHFHTPDTNVQYQILITPKMSFGTGHHPTTKMMMMAMLETNFLGKKVADFGTGTGILSILAVLMGADEVIALDNDDWSIENVKENVELNKVDNIRVVKTDNLDDVEQVDVILANINKHVLIENVADMRSTMKQKGELIISGLLRSDYEDILTVFTPYFGSNYVKLVEGDWLALIFKP